MRLCGWRSERTEWSEWRRAGTTSVHFNNWFTSFINLFPFRLRAACFIWWLKELRIPSLIQIHLLLCGKPHCLLRKSLHYINSLHFFEFHSNPFSKLLSVSFIACSNIINWFDEERNSFHSFTFFQSNTIQWRKWRKIATAITHSANNCNEFTSFIHFNSSLRGVFQIKIKWFVPQALAALSHQFIFNFHSFLEVNNQLNSQFILPFPLRFQNEWNSNDFINKPKQFKWRNWRVIAKAITHQPFNVWFNSFIHKLIPAAGSNLIYFMKFISSNILMVDGINWMNVIITVLSYIGWPVLNNKNNEVNCFYLWVLERHVR